MVEILFVMLMVWAAYIVVDTARTHKKMANIDDRISQLNAISRKTRRLRFLGFKETAKIKNDSAIVWSQIWQDLDRR